jgi:hypothetical protein
MTDYTRTPEDIAADRELQELVAQHAARQLASPIDHYPAEAEPVAPVGMTLEDEAEIEMLIEMANAGIDGDERAAIDRLVTVLEDGPA